MADRCGSRLAVCVETITRSNSDQAAVPRSRNLGSSWVTKSSENLRRSSPCHCSISDGGTSTSTDRANPRRSSSLSTKPGFDRLAQADFVAQQGPAAKPPQDGLGGADLVVQQFHLADQRQAHQLVEPHVRAQPCRPHGQLELAQPGVACRVTDEQPPILAAGQHHAHAAVRDEFFVVQRFRRLFHDNRKDARLAVLEPQRRTRIRGQSRQAANGDFFAGGVGPVGQLVADRVQQGDKVQFAAPDGGGHFDAIRSRAEDGQPIAGFPAGLDACPRLARQ